MRKALFQINEGPIYMGYTSGARWNGWATPYFTLEEAQKLQAEWNIGEDLSILYDVTKDAFICKYEDDDEPYIWEGEDIQTVDGIKHLYGIGAYSHIWDEVDESDRQYLAQEVADFILQYDTYNYIDDDATRDELVEQTIGELKNLDTLVKVYHAMNDDSLDKIGIYARLTEVLTL